MLLGFLDIRTFLSEPRLLNFKTLSVSLLVTNENKSLFCIQSYERVLNCLEDFSCDDSRASGVSDMDVTCVLSRHYKTSLLSEQGEVKDESLAATSRLRESSVALEGPSDSRPVADLVVQPPTSDVLFVAAYGVQVSTVDVLLHVCL